MMENLTEAPTRPKIRLSQLRKAGPGARVLCGDAIVRRAGRLRTDLMPFACSVTCRIVPDFPGWLWHLGGEPGCRALTGPVPHATLDVLRCYLSARAEAFLSFSCYPSSRTLPP